MADKEEPSANRKWVIGVAVLLGLGLVVAGGVALAGRNENEQGSYTGVKVAQVGGALAPDFTLVNLEGENVSLSDFKGQPVLINLWATWCGPCRIEMPTIQSRFEEYRDEGFIVLAVNFDEPRADVQSFRDKFELTFQTLLDPGAEVQKLYRTRSYPTSFFVDRKGVIQAQHIGVMTEGNLDGNLAQIGLGN
ncbi:MAG: peroxiredoxin family protein [Anaerolineales bacterium]